MQSTMLSGSNEMTVVIESGTRSGGCARAAFKEMHGVSFV